MPKFRNISTLHRFVLFLFLLLIVGIGFPAFPAYAENNSPNTKTGSDQTPGPVSTLTPTSITTTQNQVTPGLSITTTGSVTQPDATPSEVQTPTPVATNTEQQAEQEALKKATLEKANTYLLTRGQPLPEAIDNWLATCHSPQVQEAPAGKTIGQVYLELGWKYGINPAYALAFFTKESSCGTNGDNLAAHNFGNIRWTPGYPTLDGIWRSYPSWTAGMEDWFKLIKEGYVQPGANTLGKILPIYAPETENDTTLYMNEVMGWVNMLMASSGDWNSNLQNSWKDTGTDFQIGWDFLNYWRNHGGEAVLGKPTGNQEYENGRVVQYFEKGVLEYHPENKIPERVLMRAIENKNIISQAKVPGERGENNNLLSNPQSIQQLENVLESFWQEQRDLPGKILVGTSAP